MLQLAIRGHATRGREVIQLLEMLGADRLGYKDTFVGFYYYIECDAIVSSDKCPIDAIVFTLEEFEKLYPYKVGDKVIFGDIDNIVWEIESMQWVNNEIKYIIRDNNKSRLCDIKAEHLQSYKEETNMKEIKSIDLNKLEQQLNEALAKETPESLNKWMNEEMKKGSKLININPKLVGNECVHFPIPPNMKLEVKDGMCYLYRDCGEYKENKCLQELKEYLSHATREELDKTMEEIEIALAPFKVGDKVIVKGYEGMGEDEIICVFKTYDGDIKYKTKNHLDTHYFMEDSFTRVEKSYKAETMEVINIDIPKGYEFARIDNGKQQVVFTKKQPQYPKDFGECCEVLGIEEVLWFVYEDIDGNHINPACISNYRIRRLDLYHDFEKLSICRDAYWKIYGEQMGLDKPWEPDWTNTNSNKYCIYYVGNEIKKQPMLEVRHFLAFPTSEMRDAFFENFKVLINECKELL